MKRALGEHLPSGPKNPKNLKKLRRACESRLAALEVADQYSVIELCDHLSRSRGRPLRLVPMNLGESQPCGLWVATGTEDFIIYEARTTRLHQEHIIAHELAHMICCHRGVGELDDVSARLLFPDIDPKLVRDMLRRSGYSEPEEQEAEMMASLLLQRSVRHSNDFDDELIPELPREAADIISRIVRTIGHSS